MQIFVKTVRGKTISLDVKDKDTVRDIKTKIDLEEPVEQQRLIYDGKPLDDDKTCAAYSIEKNSTLFQVMNISGGGRGQAGGVSSPRRNPEDAFPASFYCMITHCVMDDPVMDPSGHTYERSAIMSWLQEHHTSPITREPLEEGQLISNRALRDAIEEAKRPASPLAVEDQPDAVSSEVAATAELCEERALLSVTAYANTGSEALLYMSAQPPIGSEGSRTPCDLVVIIDVSGSMATEVESVNEAGVKESHGLTILDLVKHAALTIAATLGPKDRLAIVKYSDEGQTVVDLTNCTDEGRVRLNAGIKSLEADGLTNLWGGLKTGLDLLKAAASNADTKQSARRFGKVLLLTDGQPTVQPPRGEEAMLRRYFETNGCVGTISTFGFGYSLDSKLLESLSSVGSGTYSFIPDGSLLGTVFVNACATTLATVGTNVTVDIELPDGWAVSQKQIEASVPPSWTREDSWTAACRVPGLTPTEWGCQVKLGEMQFGQSRDYLIRIEKAGGQTGADEEATIEEVAGFAKLSYQMANGADVEISSAINFSHNELLSPEANGAFARMICASAIRGATLSAKKESLPCAKEVLHEAISNIRQLKLKNHAAINASELLQDLEGQVSEAVRKVEWFSRWGVHYLPALCKAHETQTCMNFKDPGLQSYGGAAFGSLRDWSDAKFCSLPPPKPSRPRRHPSSGSTSVSMRSYMNARAICFAGECQVTMADGSRQRVDAVRKGDKVMMPNGNPAAVQCIVVTPFEKGHADLVCLDSGLIITPFHPIWPRGASRWTFPAELAEPQQIKCPAVYSFVLSDGGSCLLVNDTPAVSLGHELKDSPAWVTTSAWSGLTTVAEHQFFGTKAVITELKMLHGWHEGRIVLPSGGSAVRGSSGQSCGYHGRVTSLIETAV